MGLWAVIRQAAVDAPDKDPEKVAKQLLQSLGRAELLALLAREIAGAQRQVVATVEAAAFRAASASPKAAIESADRLTAFRPLLAARIKLGDGSGGVTWGQATVAEHQQRIAFLAKLRDGIDQTIERHREAIALLSESGAACLDDLASSEAAAA